MQRSLYRTLQARPYVLSSQSRTDIPAALERLLTDGARTRFRTLAQADQRHLIAVAEQLKAAGASDDLVTAGLLHDIGKALPGRAIRLHDRVAKVLLERAAPGLLARVADRPEPPRIGSGLWVVARHAQAGSGFARDEGYSDRVQWLIARHERRDLASDADLRLLIAADGAGLPPPAR